MDELATTNCLVQKIKTNQAKIGVIGLGYVGLPLILEAVTNGFTAYGIDTDNEKITSLINGESDISDFTSLDIQKALATKRFYPTTDFSQIAQLDVIIICVPTPTKKDGSPDITYIKDAAEKIQQYVTRETLIILESTTFPGTTRKVVLPIINKSGLTIGKDFFLTYSPERIDPGNRQFTITNTPKVVGGLTEKCTNLAKVLYESVLKTEVHTVSTPEIAEMEKLLENTFRQVNIALINEVSKACYAMDIDSWEVVNAAATKPYGFMKFTPGPGVGGHCIPIDPKYLSWIAEQHGMKMTIIDTANEINKSMPNFIVDRIEQLLVERNKKLSEAKLVIIGVTYKPNVQDMRETPAIPILQRLQDEQCKISIIDPYVTSVIDISTVSLTEELIKQADGIVILTNHQNINYELLDKHARFIFDTRNTSYDFTNNDYWKL